MRTDPLPSAAAPRRSSRASEGGAGGRFLVLVLVAVLVFTGVGVAFYLGAGPLPDPEGCEVTVGRTTVELDTEQAENATLIAALGVRRGLPARAVSIALATARQESKLRNLDHGDRDSLGLFQQRPSQGWGTERQVQRPTYAINAFYDALEQVPGYEEMRITEAAQEVQRSAFPEAYALHEEDSRALASALTGYSGGGRFSCTVRHSFDENLSDRLTPAGLTPAAGRVRRNLERAFGDLPLGGFAPGGIASGHSEGSAHYEGRAVDVFVRPVTEANNRLGWAISAYLVAHASRLKIDHVIFDARIWSAGARSELGWRDYDVSRDANGDRAVLLHRDHVHVDVVD